MYDGFLDVLYHTVLPEKSRTPRSQTKSHKVLKPLKPLKSGLCSSHRCITTVGSHPMSCHSMANREKKVPVHFSFCTVNATGSTRCGQGPERSLRTHKNIAGSFHGSLRNVLPAGQRLMVETWEFYVQISEAREAGVSSLKGSQGLQFFYTFLYSVQKRRKLDKT